MKEITKDWLGSAQTDLETIKEIVHLERLTPVACFHSQQTIEKSLKAIIEEFDLGFVKSHDLLLLYEKVKNIIMIENEELLEKVNILYIDTRYPGEFGLLPEGKPTLQDAREFYEFAREIYETVNDRLS